MRRPGSLFLLLFFAATAQAHELPSGSLAALGRIWGVVEYAHPWRGYRELDWDAAGVHAIERVRMSPGDLGGAITEMLATLEDDATFVRRPCVEAALPAVDRSMRTLAPGIVYVSATAAADASTIAALRNAKAAVVDLRPQPGRCAAPVLSPALVPLLVRGNVPRAKLRKVSHHGYRSQDPASTDPEFRSSFVTIDPGIESGTAEAAKVVFIVSERSAIPQFATALAAAETATFVSAGRFPLASALDHCEVGLADGRIVTLRTSELVDADGYGAEPSAMITFAADAPEADVIAAALQLAKPRAMRRRASGPSVALRLSDYRWQRDATYADMTLPSPAYRILAAYRVWNVIQFFHADAEAMGHWFMHFGEILSLFEHAATRQQYELALAEAVALADDGQATVGTGAADASPPFRLMPVEEKVVVIESGTPNVKPGDELLRMDGRDVAERMTELARYVSASTDAAKKAAILRDLPNGTASSQSIFTFRKPDGTTYDVPLARGVRTFNDPKPWRILDGNIAYVDMRDLDAEEVPTLFTEVAGTRAMILDLRNGSRGVIAEMAERLNVTGATSGSAMRVPELIGGTYQTATLPQNLGGSSLPTYSGRTIALVDERTQGTGEQLAMTLATIAQTEIVGATTAGASGLVTSLIVPGNILVRFTGSAVQDPGGRKVFGVGVLPRQHVTRTIHALAEGRDEVLEKAVETANR